MWEPSLKAIESSEMTRFQNYCGLGDSSYSDFHKWSVDESHKFWNNLATFYEVSWEGDSSVVCTDDSFKSYGWYPGVSLNFAENLLKKGRAEDIALNAVFESGQSQKISYKELRSITGQFQNGLKEMNFGAGDVLACYMPNISETVMAMLGASSLGGVFTSTSADFGTSGVVDRFGQSKPKVLVTVSSYEYNGKKYSLIPRLKEIAEKLPFIEKIVIVDFLNHGEDISEISKAISWNDFISKDTSLEFTNMKFSDPLYIMYSSGTTGQPKCIIHGAGGTLLQHIKEHGLHTNVTQEKNLFYFTTCGWMMWNWLVSGLYFGGTITLYEGSPSFPSLGEFFEIIDRENINIFGTSPKFLKVLEDSGYINKGGLKSLETILSTGAPLIEEQFDFIYEKLKKDICVSSISGGTDIISCFMLGNPNLPVYRGEIQCLGLGMDVAAVDDKGNALINEEGELVCRKSFPSRPIAFLNDPEGKKIHEAYFEVYENFWHHGDFIKISAEGGVSVAGRSDATLNPGGVRIGTAEIYRQTEKISWIEDSVCVGKTEEGEVEVVLFVKLKANEKLTDERVKEIKIKIKENTTPRHVPKNIWEVTDIPYTRSGKKMELAITRILAGRELTNIEAVANPDCLEQYQKFN